jgi:peptidoglycan/LPS O-acetylase OafA/YrhL
MLYNIQISRGIAAMLVLIAHANLMVNPALFHGVFLIGWSGLHFFFVLSGFIIFQAHSHQIACPGSFRPYIYKRIRRIYPIYWVYTLGVLAINFIAAGFFLRHLITWTGLNTETIIQSLALWPTNMSTGDMPIIPVAWTLSYEILFYVVFGIMLLVRPWLSVIVVSLWLLLIFSSMAGIIKSGPPLLSVAANPMNLEFMLGCFAGYLARKSRCQWPRPATVIMLASGLFLLALAWYNAHANYTLLGKLDALQFGIPFFLIVLGLALLERGQIHKSGPMKRIAVYVGDASYSIYLTHFILIVALVPLFKKAAAERSIFDFVSVVLLSLIAGCIGYSAIEKPLLKCLPREWPLGVRGGTLEGQVRGA